MCVDPDPVFLSKSFTFFNAYRTLLILSVQNVKKVVLITFFPSKVFFENLDPDQQFSENGSDADPYPKPWTKLKLNK